MGGADHAHIDIIASTYLRCWDDNLSGFRVVCVGDGVIQEADGAHNSASLAGLALGEVRGVADDDTCFSDLKTTRKKVYLKFKFKIINSHDTK